MYNGSMSAGENAVSPPDCDSFEALLDNTCSRLWDRKLRYSLRRIRELADILDRTDRELEELLLCGRVSGSPGVFPPAGVSSPAAAARTGSEGP
jgi:hypothetical protein